jgi:hypothetical protein
MGILSRTWFNGLLDSSGLPTDGTIIDKAFIDSLLDDVDLAFRNHFINVKDSTFGALGNGVSDDRAAIQAAIDAMYSVINGTGRTAILFLPKGEYKVNGTLVLKNTPSLGPGGGIIMGAGMEASVIKLANMSGVPVLDIGDGTLAGYVPTLQICNLGIDGNRTNQIDAAAVGIRARLIDRCTLRNLLVYHTYGHGYSIDESSVLLDACQSDDIGGHCIAVSNSTSVTIKNGFHNRGGQVDATGRSVYVTFTAAGDQVNSQGETHCTIIDNHLEQSVGGAIHIENADNCKVIANQINIDASAARGIYVSGTSRWNEILHNVNDQRSYGATADDNSVTLSSQVFCEFAAGTYGNVYRGVNGHEVVTAIGGSTVHGPMMSRVIDRGDNTIEDAGQTGGQYFAGRGGHSHAGWSDTLATNLIFPSEDFSDAGWTKSNIASVTQTATYRGNPYDEAAGLASEIVISAGQVGHVVKSATITLAAGDLATASVFARSPGAVAVDVRLEILDASDNVLARWFCLLPSDALWRRYWVTMNATGAHTSLKLRIRKPVYGASATFIAWGAMLNGGKLAAYIPTTTAALSTPPGIVAMCVTATKDLCLNIPSATTVGAAGGAAALPATPSGYWRIRRIDGVYRKVPFYND